MADYRVYIRNALLPFDGTTPETAAYAGVGHKFNTPSTATVGLWSPSSLGRFNCCSLIQVFSDDTVQAGDIVQVFASTGTLRYVVPLLTSGSGWLFAEPDDLIAVTATAVNSVEIVVNDLNDDQLTEYLSAIVIAGGGVIPPVLPQNTIFVTATQAIPAYSGGELIVFIDAGLDADLTLPALVDVELGSSIVFIRRSGNGQVRIIAEDVADEVNGDTGITVDATQYFIRSTGETIRYLRVENGWEHRAGEQVYNEVSANASPYDIAAFKSGTLYILDLMVGLNSILNLPSLNAVKEGCRIVIQNQDTFQHRVLPLGGDLIDGQSFLKIPARSIAILEAGSIQAATPSWYAYGTDISLPNSVAIAAPGSINITGGKTYVSVTLGIDGNITLPSLVAPNAPAVGSEIKIIRVGGVGTPRIVTAAAIDQVNGVAGFVETEYFLRSIGDSITYTLVGTGMWQRDFGDQAPEALLAVASPINVPQFTGGTQYVLDNSAAVGTVINIPAGNTCKAGVRIGIRNLTDELHTILPTGGDTFNGAASWNLAPRELVYLENATGAASWFVYGGGLQTVPVVTAANTLISPFIGEFFIETTGGAGQTVTLPQLSTLGLGAKVYMYNSSGSAKVLAADAADTILGAASQPIAMTSGFVAYNDGSGDWKGWLTP